MSNEIMGNILITFFGSFIALSLIVIGLLLKMGFNTQVERMDTLEKTLAVLTRDVFRRQRTTDCEVNELRDQFVWVTGQLHAKDCIDSGPSPVQSFKHKSVEDSAEPFVPTCKAAQHG